MSSQNTLFAGDSIYFHPTSAQTIFLRYSLFESDMDAGLFIYFPRDPGQNIYFKVLTARIFLFKAASPPPPSAESTVHLLTKKGTGFNHSPTAPTAILKTYMQPCPEGLGLVDTIILRSLAFIHIAKLFATGLTVCHNRDKPSTNVSLEK